MKKLVLSILSIFLPLLAGAEIVEFDGLYYNIDSHNNTAEVTQDPSKNKYTGDIIIPEKFTHNEKIYQVTSISKIAFYKCSELVSVEMPNSIIYIGDAAFEDCDGLISVTFSNSLGSIGFNAFYNCDNLTIVKLPSSVKGIGDDAFAWCRNLKDIYCYANDPPNIYSNGAGTSGAFDYTKTGATLHIPKLSIDKYRNDEYWKGFGTYVALPETDPNIEPINEIGGHEFVDLGLPSGRLWAKTNYGAYSDGDDGEYINWNDRIIVSQNWGSDWGVPSYDDILELYNNCDYYWKRNNKDVLGCYFKGKNGNSIFLPTSGYWIIHSYGTLGRLYYWTDTKSNTPNYAHCLTGGRDDGLNPNDIFDYTQYLLPIRPVVMSKTAYDFKPDPIPVDPVPDPTPVEPMPDPTPVNPNPEPTPEIPEPIKFAFGEIYYEIISDDEVSVTSGEFKYEGDINIPEHVTYNDKTYRVTSIGYCAFQDCNDLTSIVIPNSVTSVGTLAFERCINLNSVSFGKNVNSIGWKAFANCTALTYIYIPNNVNLIDGYAFYDCWGLTTIEIGDGVTNIGDYAFYQCYSLTSLKLGKSLKTIGSYAFEWCPGLTSINFPDSVTSIGEYAFWKCYNLAEINLGNSINYIGGGAFSCCSELTSVIIPQSIEFIGYEAFNEVNLTSVISLNDDPNPISNDSFNEYTYNNAVLKVPDGSLDKYYSKEGWSLFKKFEILSDIEYQALDINKIKRDKLIEHYYNLNGLKVKIPQKGINIYNGKKVIIK